jgi:hypothetical protein
MAVQKGDSHKNNITFLCDIICNMNENARLNGVHNLSKAKPLDGMMKRGKDRLIDTLASAATFPKRALTSLRIGGMNRGIGRASRGIESLSKRQMKHEPGSPMHKQYDERLKNLNKRISDYHATRATHVDTLRGYYKDRFQNRKNELPLSNHV